MTTIRVEKTKNFSIISNHHLNNPTLSLKAKGLLTYLLSRSDNWNANVNHLVTTCTDGKKAIYSAIKELKEAGYIEHVTIRDDKAKILKWEYVVHEHPLEKPVNSEEKLLSQKGQVGKGQVGKGDRIVNTDRIPKTESSKNELRKAESKANPQSEASPQNRSSSFSKDDLKILTDAVPDTRKSKDVEKRLTKALIAGFTVAYLLDCIAYSHDKANGNFLGYLGNCIDKDYAPEGYHKKAVEKRRKEEERAAREKQRHLSAIEEKRRKAEEEAALKRETEEKDALLESVDISALDDFIDSQELKPYDRQRFRQEKRLSLRRRYVVEFVAEK